jgi:periplasmic divalent cation tolerance protein
MVIKTLTTKFKPLSDRITQLHTYDIAEIIAVDIKAGNSPYLQWISESLDS